MSDVRRDLCLLFCLALVVRLAVAVLWSAPPYMDAHYYTAGACRLAEGSGMTEPFLWNYLNDPAGIPNPGFLYWMPLPSILAAPFVAWFSPLLGRFLAAQLPFVFLSALLPLVAYGLARQVMRLRCYAWGAGLLAIFGGLLTPYWTLPETFTPFALVGSLALWLAGYGPREVGGKGVTVTLFAGVLAGLAHLTRADGPLLLAVIVLAPLMPWKRSDGRFRWCSFLVRSLIALGGYLLVMGPWFVRNLKLLGAPLSPSGTATLWLTDYDDIFCYDCQLSPSSYLAWGWDNILSSKLFALRMNGMNLLATDCLVFLLPFVVIGLLRLRRRPAFVLAAIYLALVYLVHSVGFTFPGWRGGFLHAGAAVLPFLYASSGEGLDVALRWMARRRGGWNLRRARVVFIAGFVFLAILVSIYGVWRQYPAWHESGQAYEQVAAWMDGRGVSRDVIIMVGNPPGFWYHGRRPAVVVPNGGVSDLLQVAGRYGVEYLVLDRNHPQALTPIYTGEQRHPQLELVAEWDRRGQPVLLFSILDR